MLKSEMIIKNQQLQGKREWIRWAESRRISSDNTITVVDPTHEWNGMVGYLTAGRTEDSMVLVYLPMTKCKGQTGTLRLDQIKSGA